MKKSVIILIGIIYIASIFVVGFFGMKVKNYNVMVYIEDIEWNSFANWTSKSAVGIEKYYSSNCFNSDYYICCFYLKNYVIFFSKISDKVSYSRYCYYP